MPEQYILKKDASNTYRIFNKKSNTLLKPIYKSRQTALRNLEKKNCITDANDKFPIEKKKKEPKQEIKKPVEMKIEKPIIMGNKVTMKTIEAKVKKDQVKRKKEQKEESKRKPKLPKVLTNIVKEYESSSSTKKLWNDLKDELVEIHENYEYAYKLFSAVEIVSDENGKKVPKIVEQVINATNPRLIQNIKGYKSPTKEVIDKISKIILRNTKDTKKIVEDVMSKLYDSDKYDNMSENTEVEMSGGFDGIYEVDFEEDNKYSFYTFKDKTKNLKELKDETQKQINKFYENLIDYFKAKSQKIKRDVTIDNI